MTTLQQAQAELLRKRQALPKPPVVIRELVEKLPPFEDTSTAPVEWPDSSTALGASLPIRRPERVSLDTLDARHPKVATAVKMARAWAERRRAGYMDASIILLGPNGTGKTHVARAIWWSITQAAVDGGREIPGTAQPVGHFYLSNDLTGLLGTTRDAETGAMLPARASAIIGNTPLVVIDDVGAEQSIPFVAATDQDAERQARFFKVIDHCYQKQVSVIITSNLTVDGLAAHVGRRAWDRLVQMAPKLANGDSFIVDLAGVPSWRVKVGGR